jgi:ubiquinone/menaquinone biosynthesis C-methylase UbiE
VYAGLKLGVFEALTAVPADAGDIATRLGMDRALGSRLLRALASLGLLVECDGPAYAVAAPGELLKRDHPKSMCDAFLLREGPEHTAVWKHLADIVRSGEQNGFVREFGVPAFEHATRDRSYGEAFNAGMSSQSNLQTAWTLEALSRCGLDSAEHVCDIGGGQGHLLSHLLLEYPHLRGTVFDRPSVVEQTDRLWAQRIGVEARCQYVAGDMFIDVPTADVYMMKMILHDWNDAECKQILRHLARRATAGTRLFIVEHVIPATGKPNYAAMFDMHMMCWGTGCERTEREYAVLLEGSGWIYEGTTYPASKAIGVVAAGSAKAGNNNK